MQIQEHVQKELREWFGNIRGDFFAGLVSAFAVIPEVIGFCIIAGISPMMGLYASFWLCVLLAFIGGRPAMISAAAGSMALVIVSLVRDHGPEYLMAATILTGFIMIVAGLLKVGKLISLVPNSVNIGFVNALAILIFSAQLEHFKGEGWHVFALVGLGLAIIYLLPKVFTKIPSTLVAVVIVTAIAMFSGSPVRTIGDMGDITASLPIFALPNVPINLETLKIILPYSISLALVGMVETLLTAKVVDEMTETSGNTNRECTGLGIANIVSGFFGGTCGCAMIGQAIANVESGGRGRFSMFVSGAFLMVLIFLLNDILVQIPLAALVAVMVYVSIKTFDWNSLRTLFKIPRTDAFVIILVVAVVVATNNLAIGVILGLVMSAIFFAVKMSKIKVTAFESETEKNTLVYSIKGELFFASTTAFSEMLDFKALNQNIQLDFSKGRIWDESAVTTVKKSVDQFRRNGHRVELTGLDEQSLQLLNYLGDKEDYLYDRSADLSNHSI